MLDTRSRNEEKRPLAGLAGGIALIGFGGGGGSDDINVPPLQFEREVEGRAVVKLASGRAGLVALDEQLVSLSQFGPRRTLVVTPADGQALRRVDAPPDWSLVDFSQHASGDLTAVLTRQGLVRLWRLSALGALKRDEPFADVMVATDPDFGAFGAIHRRRCSPC